MSQGQGFFLYWFIKVYVVVVAVVVVDPKLFEFFTLVQSMPGG